MTAAVNREQQFGSSNRFCGLGQPKWILQCES